MLITESVKHSISQHNWPPNSIVRIELTTRSVVEEGCSVQRLGEEEGSLRGVMNRSDGLEIDF